MQAKDLRSDGHLLLYTRLQSHHLYGNGHDGLWPVIGIISKVVPAEWFHRTRHNEIMWPTPQSSRGDRVLYWYDSRCTNTMATDGAPLRHTYDAAEWNAPCRLCHADQSSRLREIFMVKFWLGWEKRTPS